MKLFKDLTPGEQDLALDLERENLLSCLVDGTMVSDDPTVQGKVNLFIGLCARRRTSELATKYIYAACKLKIDSIVAGMVQSNLYSEPQEVVINNVVGCVPQTERHE